MLKHKGFPSRLPGSDFQFTIRRDNKSGPTPLVERVRHADRKPADRRADEGFIWALWTHFAEECFMRGNLDAGRLSWVLGREVIAAEPPLDPADYGALLRLDITAARKSFPAVFDGSYGT